MKPWYTMVKFGYIIYQSLLHWPALIASTKNDGIHVNFLTPALTFGPRSTTRQITSVFNIMRICSIIICFFGMVYDIYRGISYVIMIDQDNFRISPVVLIFLSMHLMGSPVHLQLSPLSLHLHFNEFSFQNQKLVLGMNFSLDLLSDI